MTREEAKQKFDNFGKSFTLEEARLDTHILIDQIYDAHEAELQELTQVKSCEGCKHYRTSIDDFPYCEKYERRNLEDEDFYCDRLGFKDHYTPKG